MKAAGKRISIFLAVCLLFQFVGFSASAEEPEASDTPSITVSLAPAENAPPASVPVTTDAPPASAAEAPVMQTDSAGGGGDADGAAPVDGNAAEERSGLSASEGGSRNEEQTQTQNLMQTSGLTAVEGQAQDEGQIGDERSALGQNRYEGQSQDGDRSQEEDEGQDESQTAGAETDIGLHLSGEGSFDVLITGTLETDGIPVLIDESVSPDNVYITVWKIEEPVEVDGNEHLVLEESSDSQPAPTADSEAVEASIQYIIKIEPTQEDCFTLGGTGESHGYDVAKEGDTVTMKIRVPSGSTLKGAFNGDGEKVPLEKDADGNYYVTVPKGGGVFLSAEFEKDRPSPDSSPDDWDISWYDPSPVKAAGSEKKDRSDESDEDLFITFDLNGGKLAGSTGPILIRGEIGKDCSLLDAPSKDGAEFVRWRSLSADVTVSQPGESFVVEHSVTFVAVWSDEEDSQWSGAPGAGPDASSEEEDDGPDETKTVRITENSDEELNIGSITVEDDAALGVEILADGELDVDRGITVKGQSSAAGVQITADGRNVTAEVETGDGMTVVASDGPAVGIRAAAENGGGIQLEFEGDADISGSGGSTGIDAQASAGSSAAISVEGDIKTG